ncbi:MAG: dienelactone hydrolase family protein [Armatimonadaceae bacterium]
MSETMTRRDVITASLTTGLTTGFALAVEPVCAQTMITTDTRGLTAGEVKIKGKDGFVFPAYRAMPQNGKNLPAVLVVQEIFGVHEHIKDVCRRFAKKGYYAVAPELYARQGSVADKQMNEIFAVVQKVPDSQVMNDLDETVSFAKASGAANTGKLGITGFCWGGRIVWLYAAHNPAVDAGVAWYGRLEGQESPLQPTYPLDVVGKIKAPILGLYAGQDRGIPLESVEKMRAALKKADSKSEMVVYPEAQHGFHADYRPSYNKEAATDGWKRLLDWFQKYGVA